MSERRPSFRVTALALAAAVGLALAYTALDIVPAASQDAWLLAAKIEASEKVSEEVMDPWSGLWSDVRPTQVVLSAQNATKPLGGGQVATLRARALHDGGYLYIMLEWKDKTLDDTVNGQNVFADAAAVQLPAVAGVSIPSFCMGDANGSVNIWQWKAVWQRDIDSGFTADADRYPDGFADGYLLQDDPVYQPARKVGNILSQTGHAYPVENLVAAGFGTLTTADLQDVKAQGEWKDGRWRIVFARALQTGAGYPSMAESDVTNIAFAVWDGSKGNRDGLKSVSQFMNLQVLSSSLQRGGDEFPWWGWAIVAAIVATAALSLGVAYRSFGARREPGEGA